MAHQFRTVQDMLDAVYGGSFSIAKADDPVLSSTSGFFNAVYGARAFAQLNYEANAFAVLPKYPWQHSGFRVITTDPTAGGGVAEDGSIPDTDKPAIVEVDVSPKQVVHTFQNSFIQEGLVKKGDDAVGDMEYLRNFYAAFHAKNINSQLLTDGDTLAGNNFESIDRVTASAALASAQSWTAADEDIYDIDRSGASWSDAVVDHNSGTDRTLEVSIIEDTLGTLEGNGARTNVILTGADTKWRIIGLLNNQVRYEGVLRRNEMVQIGLNGVESDEGAGFGVRVATIYGVPLFSSQHVPQDTISRIYLLDTTEQEGTGVPRLGISLLYPTMYFESGMSASDGDPFGINFLGTKGMYYTAGELICTFFKAQGSIRDLK